MRRGQRRGGEYNLEYHASSRLVPVQCSADERTRWPSAVGRGSRMAFDSTSGLPHMNSNIATAHAESIMYPQIEAESKATRGRPVYAFCSLRQVLNNAHTNVTGATQAAQ